MQSAIRTLLVTNDFPPTVGGIQSYLRDFAAELANRVGPENLVVFASTQDAEAAHQWDASVPYTVVRWPRRVMFPTPATAREVQRLIRVHGIATVWFGAAAPNHTVAIPCTRIRRCTSRAVAGVGNMTRRGQRTTV